MPPCTLPSQYCRRWLRIPRRHAECGREQRRHYASMPYRCSKVRRRHRHRACDAAIMLGRPSAIPAPLKTSSAPWRRCGRSGHACSEGATTHTERAPRGPGACAEHRHARGHRPSTSCGRGSRSCRVGTAGASCPRAVAGGSGLDGTHGGAPDPAAAANAASSRAARSRSSATLTAMTSEEIMTVTATPARAVVGFGTSGTRSRPRAELQQQKTSCREMAAKQP